MDSTQNLCAEMSGVRKEICQLREQRQLLIDLLKQQNELFKKLISDKDEASKNPEVPKGPKFPIESQTELDAFENYINEENEEELIEQIRPLIMPYGLKDNIKYVLKTEICIHYNTDGRKGRTNFLNYSKFSNLLFRATKREGSWSYEKFLNDLKLGLDNRRRVHEKSIYNQMIRVKKSKEDY